MIWHLKSLESLWDMISYLSGNTFASVGNLAQTSHLLHQAESDSDGRVHIVASLFVTLHQSVVEIQRIAQELDLDATKGLVDDSIGLLTRYANEGDHYVLQDADAERLCWTLSALVRSFTAQLQSKKIIVFEGRNSVYLTSDDPPFGEAVDDAFPKAAEDISEAAKCLALQRNTACVFHLMRAMESAVGRLAEAIGTGKSTNKEWGKILSDIGQKIESLPKGEDRDRWSESHSHLYHVKQAWRNDTMHPKKTYTDDQAQSVFDAVRSFMTHLAPLVV